jgi:hypothetical protein
MLLAYSYVRVIGNERGVNITENGLYRRVTLTKSEVADVLKWMHPSANIDDILLHFKAKMSTDTAHAYYSLPSNGEEADPAEEKTLGWHSDAVAAVLIQVYGAKDLEIGGIHCVPVGSAGKTVPLDELPAASFVQKKRLEPNSIVGLGARQIHRLYPCSDSEKNLTLAIKISEV